MIKQTKWRSPSNIALIKYWGKYPKQIPANPSLSFTLDNCFTETEIILSEKKEQESFNFDVFLNGHEETSFKPKIEKFFKEIENEATFIKDFHLRIETFNSFPHSSGIASSASGMSALALCLLSLQEEISGFKEKNFLMKASKWSRLGSGSACRSVYGGLVLWGEHSGLVSSNEYAVPYVHSTHPVFDTFRDYVLLVEVGSKSVSSSAGHELMNNHPFAEKRFLQAGKNLELLQGALKKGDLESFGEVVEGEALSLHAMMMTSKPSFILMKPNTLSIIDHIRNFRKKNSLPLYFTLDAGANVHLLFPEYIEQAVNEFVKSELLGYMKNEQYICDRVGKGPEKLK